MRKHLRRVAPLTLAFVSVFALALPAWAVNDQRFTQPRVYDASDGTSEVVAADLNGDKTLDLVTANRGENDVISDSPSDGDVSIIFGNPDGTFGATTEIDSFGSSPERSLANTATDVIAADLDEDGDLDLALTDLGDPPTPPGTDGENNGGFGYLVTLLNDGSGTFERRDAELLTGSVNPVELVAANFDNESDLEIAVANAGAGAGGSVAVLRNSGEGNFTEESLYTANDTDSVLSIDAADFDNDDQQDLVVTHDDGATGSNDEAFIYEGNSGENDRTFTAGATIPVGDSPRHVLATRLDTANRSFDVVTANFESDNLTVALGNNNGSFASPASYGAGTNPYSVAVADFNIDEKPDLAAVNSYDTAPGLPAENGNDQGTVSVLNGNGNGTFQNDRENETADGPIGIAAAPFNDDDLPDIATANFGEDGPDKEDGSVAVLFGKFQCADGADNDTDGKTDAAEDPGCDNATDNSESPDPINYSIDDVAVTEGNADSTATFTVTRAGDELSKSTSVSYAAVDGTAVQPEDYTLASGTLNFGPDETTKSIQVTIKGDTRDEQNENYTVRLSNPTNGSRIADGEGLGTINDNDPPPAQCDDGIDNDGDGKTDFPADPGCGSVGDNTEDSVPPTLSISDTTVTEGDSGTVNATFTVTRTGPTTGQSSVRFATQDGTADQPADYEETTGTLQFAAGETSKTIQVPVKGDTQFEGDERFRVNLTDPTGAAISDNQGVGNIVNDDPPPETDLALDITDDPGQARRGSTVVYKLKVSNQGSDDASGVEVKLTIPTGTEYTTPPSGCSVSGRVATCDLGTISSGDSRSVDLTVKVNRGTDFAVKGRISGSDATDTNDTNDRETEKTRVR